jgi:hypothetical protein
MRLQGIRPTNPVLSVYSELPIDLCEKISWAKNQANSEGTHSRCIRSLQATKTAIKHSSDTGDYQYFTRACE